jgi:ribonucleoside-diphosphate reductase alpha chain
MDSFATTVSVALQYGVPLRDLVSKFAHVRFEPSGFTGNAEIPIAKSSVDYIFRWMGSRFLSKEDRDTLGILGGALVADAPTDVGASPLALDDALEPGTTTDPASLTAEASPRDDAAARSSGPVTGGNGAAGSNGNGSHLASLGAGQRVAFSISSDSPSCMDCGSIMVRNGSCYKCLNCGATSGCS